MSFTVNRAISGNASIVSTEHIRSVLESDVDDILEFVLEIKKGNKA